MCVATETGTQAPTAAEEGRERGQEGQAQEDGVQGQGLVSRALLIARSLAPNLHLLVPRIAHAIVHSFRKRSYACLRIRDGTGRTKIALNAKRLIAFYFKFEG